MPGVAIANAWNSRLEPSAWPSGSRLDAQVLLHRVLRVDRDREQARRELDLLEVLAAVLEQPLDPLLAASSATIVRSPRRAPSSPSAIATVDLPTPPLPVTKIRRLSRSAGTAAAGYCSTIA